MFGAEPTEHGTEEDAAEFEVHAAARLRGLLLRAWWASAVFVTTVLAVVPFLQGHSQHGHWESVGKYFVLLAMAELPWFGMQWGFVYTAWQSAREVRREFFDS